MIKRKPIKAEPSTYTRIRKPTAPATIVRSSKRVEKRVAPKHHRFLSDDE